MAQSSQPDERAAAIRLLNGIERGTLTVHAAASLSEEIDPVLLHAVVRFLRECYPASDPAAGPVLERVVALMSARPEIVRKVREGESDPVARWFASEHGFRDFRGRGEEMLALIADKLDS